MKYKNIYSAIHNFGYSFLSSMNYVDGGFIIDEINNIRRNGKNIIIDWLNLTFEPESEATPRLRKSLEYYQDGLEGHLNNHNVEFSRLVELKLHCPAEARQFIEATDDRGKRYKIYVRESK